MLTDITEYRGMERRRCFSGIGGGGGATRVIPTPYIDLQVKQQLSLSPPGGGFGQSGVSFDSTGRHVWPTALPLLKYIIKNQQQIQRKYQEAQKDDAVEPSPSSSSLVVIDLGAGCGVLGMGLAAAAAAATATEAPYSSNSANAYNHYSTHVILTDQSTHWLEQNVSLNRANLEELIQVPSTPTTKVTMDVMRLVWGNQQDISNLQTLIEERLLLSRDGTDVPNNIGYDLMIVGSDIIYNPEYHHSLVSTVYELSQTQQSNNKAIGTFSTTNIKLNNTHVMFAHPNRSGDEQSLLSHVNNIFNTGNIDDSTGAIAVHVKDLVEDGKDKATDGRSNGIRLFEINCS